ncbi:hypothetical protein [Leucobacter japonicus]|uniref:hypothetical protein n=1 Tax=Leucobacter japonicus TaxID=1461259 RepID=UPI0006A7AE3F|nr:hypothetical protein [Leucobacter japonicus]
MAQNTRKRALIAGGIAALLIAGVSTGGALVTRDSTIFDNVFGTASEVPPTPAEMTVTGDAMSKVFTAAVDGEFEYENYTVTNLSADNSLKFNVSAKSQGGNADVAKLMANLDTRVVIDGTTIPTGKLNNMAIPAASQPTIAKETAKNVRVEVFIADAAAFQAANIAPDTELTVDFLFDSIFLP